MDTITPSPWYQALASIKSKGSQAKRPGSLAGLHAARAVHAGQFFTPLAVAAYLWRIAGPVMEEAWQQSGSRVSVLDTSAGSGRLLAFADPARHDIAASDIDAEAMHALSNAADAAGFHADIITAGMQDIRPTGHGVALINPPFSLHIDAPTLTPYPCTTWGQYGEHSSTLSHVYAVHQALDAAQVVLAIVPSTYAEEVTRSPSYLMQGRLRAMIALPAGSFHEESTEVSVAVLVFGLPEDTAPPVLRWDAPSLSDLPPDLRLYCQGIGSTRTRPLNPRTVEAGCPSIKGEVTGNRTVRVVKAGRHIGLRFACALTHAKVMNAVLTGPVKSIHEHRYPRGVKYQGEGRLDLEVYLAQAEPLAAFDGLLQTIRKADGIPNVDASLLGYLRRAARRQQRESVPFGHVVRGGVRTEGDDRLHAKVKRKRVLDPTRWGSPILKEGEDVTLTSLKDGTYEIQVGEETAYLEERDVQRDFEIQASDNTGWRTAYASSIDQMLAAAVAARAHLAPVGATDIASWDYQVEDMIELRLVRGAVAAWDMGCGKTRLAIGLCLAGGRHNAIVVEAHLVDELIDQIKEVGLPDSDWQVIRTAAQCESLRRINVLSYHRLRAPVAVGAGRRTLARLLRRKFSTVVADEAHLLRHRDTAQTRALWMLSPRRRYAMTGTPAANQIQDLIPLVQWACGDGTARQPYGWYHPFLQPGLLQTMSASRRGLDVFMERHAVFEWVTREWEDRMTGAKRQVPKVNHVGQLREWAAPLIKRRHVAEPMVAAHFQVPQATRKVITVPWDDGHLAHYLRTADLFARWYRDQCKAAGGTGKNMNLAMLLARIGAVLRACNFPQYTGKSTYGLPPYLLLSSKQKAVLDHLEKLVEEGHKTICYTDGPGQVNLLVAHLAQRGIDAVAFHGRIPIIKRTRALNQQFRFGDSPVLVANMAITQTGLNLWQADREVFTCRSWSATQENQAMARALRPQQTREVEAHFFHLEGSIDEYQAQMVGMKADTARAAVDFLIPETAEDDFIHMDQILNQFVADLAERRGLDPWRYREVLRAA